MRVFPRLLALGVLAVSVGCSTGPDLEAVVLGAEVQVTRDDGALIEGTVQARDQDKLTVKTAQDTREVLVARVADVRVVDETTPAEPSPLARFREFVLPIGTELILEVRTAVDTGVSQPNDAVDAAIGEALTLNGIEVLPVGSPLRGHISAVKAAGEVKGRASVAIDFDQVTAFDEAHPVEARFAVEAPASKADDAKTIGIGAGIGAVVGAVVGGRKGAAVGGIIGGGAGTARVLLTAGEEIRISEGAMISVSLANEVIVRVPIGR